jgi:hypothetical protein
MKILLLQESLMLKILLPILLQWLQPILFLLYFHRLGLRHRSYLHQEPLLSFQKGARLTRLMHLCLNYHFEK